MYYYYNLRTILTNETTNFTTTTVGTDTILTTSFVTNRIKFWVLLSLQFLSIPCFLYVFYQFVTKKEHRKTIHYHVVFVLLIISFLFVTIALTLTLAYMYTSEVYPANETFCSFWNWFHYSVNIINLFLMGFASIERNWLIFHPKFVNNKRRRFFLHYCPLAFCVIYPTSFYAGAILIDQCFQYYDYTQLLCTWPCYFYNTILADWDLFFNNYTPLLCIPIFCSIIYIRVFLQRQHMKQRRFKWRRDKRLILQLWLISSLYLAMWMPLQITVLIEAYWTPSFLLQAEIDYMYLFPYLIHLIYPYMVLLSFQEDMVRPNQRLAQVQPENQRRTINTK